MKVAAVIVTFNRKEMLIKNLECIINQSRMLDKVYIIDNASTDGTKEYIKEFIWKNKQIEYIRLNENLGGSGGFYNGLKKAYEDGYDFIWGMDDDAFPETFALETLIKSYAINQECKCLWSNCNADSVGFNNEGYKEVNNWMFVGFFIPREVIKKVGLPRKDFFIYHDDTEYAERIIKNGFKIYKIKDSLIEHGDFSNREMLRKKFIGKYLEFPKMPDWKLYY